MIDPNVTTHTPATLADIDQQGVEAMAAHLRSLSDYNKLRESRTLNQYGAVAKKVAQNSGREPVVAISTSMDWSFRISTCPIRGGKAGKSERLVITREGLALESRRTGKPDDHESVTLRPVTDVDLEVWDAADVRRWTSLLPSQVGQEDLVEFVGKSYAQTAFAGVRTALTPGSITKAALKKLW